MHHHNMECQIGVPLANLLQTNVMVEHPITLKTMNSYHENERMMIDGQFLKPSLTIRMILICAMVLIGKYLGAQTVDQTTLSNKTKDTNYATTQIDQAGIRSPLPDKAWQVSTIARGQKGDFQIALPDLSFVCVDITEESAMKPFMAGSQ